MPPVSFAVGLKSEISSSWPLPLVQLGFNAVLLVLLLTVLPVPLLKLTQVPV